MWVESHSKKRRCLFHLLDPEIDSKSHGFLHLQVTPHIPYYNLWLHNICGIIPLYILKKCFKNHINWKILHLFWKRRNPNLIFYDIKNRNKYLFAYGSSALTDITQGKTIVGGHLTSASGLNKLNGHCAKLFDSMPKTYKYLITKEFKSYKIVMKKFTWYDGWNPHWPCWNWSFWHR